MVGGKRGRFIVFRFFGDEEEVKMPRNRSMKTINAKT